LNDKIKIVAIDITMCGNDQCEKRDRCVRYSDDGEVLNLNPNNHRRCKYYGNKELYVNEKR
jgi:hypothetical protein